MRIFHAAFTRVLGGLEQSFINTTEALTSRGHEVMALVRADAPYRSEVAAHAAAMHTINPVGFYDLAAAWRIRRAIAQQRPDVLIGHNARAIALLHLAGRGTGVPLVGVSHSYKTARTTRADMLVVLSEHMHKHFLAAGYSKPMEIIPNLIRLPDGLHTRMRGPVPIIGAIGRFTEEKGFEDLLDALALLKRSTPNFRVRIAGDGPDAASLKAQAEKLGLAEHIQWLGWVADKRAFYSSIDILCLPSREDSFPMVVLETFANGVPMVATDAFGPASMIESGKDGLLVPRRDTQAMAQALKAMIDDATGAAAMAQAARHKIQDYDFPAIAGRWDSLLSAVTATARPRQAA